MRFIDITVPYHPGMAVFPGTGPVEFNQLRSLEKDGKNIWETRMTTVTGTHIEAPSHSIAGGASVDMIDLHKCFGPCEVIEIGRAHV